jgi:peptidoglycan/LPS O-acetylase OafA/YrhL
MKSRMPPKAWRKQERLNEGRTKSALIVYKDNRLCQYVALHLSLILADRTSAIYCYVKTTRPPVVFMVYCCAEVQSSCRKDTKMVREFAFIKCFRAIAALWVLSAHCMIWGGWYGIPLPSGKIAVDLFMMISGYLMAANASARNDYEPLTNFRNWLRFWLRRFFRLAPAYYLSLAIAIASSRYFLVGYQKLQSLNPGIWPAGDVYDPARIEYTLSNIMLHLSFLFGLHPTYSFSTFLPDWSLSLEMQFYLVFPALLLVTQRLGLIRSTLFIGLSALICGLGISRTIHYYEPSLLFFKLNYFLAGILLFRFLAIDTNNRRRLGLALCAILLVCIDLQYRMQLVVLPVLLLAMLMLGWLEATHRTPKIMSSIINGRIIRFASDTSYGVYLFHGFFISVSGLIISSQQNLLALLPWQRVLFLFVFVTLSAYLTAYLSFRIIESPGIRLGRRAIEKFTPYKK